MLKPVTPLLMWHTCHASRTVLGSCLENRIWIYSTQNTTYVREVEHFDSWEIDLPGPASLFCFVKLEASPILRPSGSKSWFLGIHLLAWHGTSFPKPRIPYIYCSSIRLLLQTCYFFMGLDQDDILAKMVGGRTMDVLTNWSSDCLISAHPLLDPWLK